MDNFTKGMLERAEKRSKQLGISTTTKFPTMSPMKENKSPRRSNKELATVSSNGSPLKTTKVTNNVNKDNADVAVEINITSNQNIQVEVEVAECEIDSKGNYIRKNNDKVNALSANYDNNKAAIRDVSRKNLKRLEVLYADNDQISSPIQRTEANFNVDQPAETSSSRPIKKFTKLADLASNINSWDDDYSRHAIAAPSPAKSKGAIPKVGTRPSQPGSPAKVLQLKSKTKSPEKPKAQPSKVSQNLMSSPSKKLMWDGKMMSSLEAQGFTRRESTVPKLVYDYTASSSSSGSPIKSTLSSPIKSSFSSPKKSILVAAEMTPKPMERKISSPAKKSFESPKKISVASPIKSQLSSPMKTNIFKALDLQANPKTVKFSTNNKDPADLSLKDRMAIFEKNKGTALIPKCAFGIAESTAQQKFALQEVNKQISRFHQQQEKDKHQPARVEPQASSSVRSAVSQLLKKDQTISEKQISDEIKKQKEIDMQCILNRHQPSFAEDKNVNSASSVKTTPTKKSVVPMEVDRTETNKRRSAEQRYDNQFDNIQKSDDKKRARVSNNRLYPILSEIESTDSEMDNYTTATVSGSESTNGPYQANSEQSTKALTNDDDSYEEYSDDESSMSLGKEILKSVQNNEINKIKRLSDRYLDSTTSSGDISGIIGDMDEYLNEALDNSTEVDEKGSVCSNSFEYERHPKRSILRKSIENKCKFETPVSSKLEIQPNQDADGKVTLVHTVSFYRRQQSASANNTPIRKIVHRGALEEQDEESESDSGSCSETYEHSKAGVDEKIKKLLNEVCKQQTVISQTSQALNLCAATVEFSGSTEAVEGERHLLVATHRRQSLMNEIQRLRVEGLVDRQGPAKERGTLTIKDITVPLKQIYMNRLATDEITGHHLVCLIKYNEHVLATKSVPTLPGLKAVRFPDTLVLDEVYADFKVTMEIYGMTAQREVLSHDVKYHIGSSAKKKTNSRKHYESNLAFPPVQSPGGPNAVRTPVLVQYGYIIFSIREIKQKSWVINEVASSVSPLNGNVFLKVDSKITVDVDHCGFLTMFDDISGFGAWHRRWCRLSGNVLHYWKYPEDEKKKEPIGKLQLINCVSERVELAPRTVCARLNTILLEFKRARRNSDVNSLVIVPKETHTIVRHLLAADTKEEREDWCDQLNKSIMLMKSWGTFNPSNH